MKMFLPWSVPVHCTMRGMICRIWHGRTPRSKAVAYTSFLVRRAIPDYRSVKGNIDVEILRWDDGDVTHFLAVTHWDSEEVIRAFAGDDLLKAKYYPEDRDFLLEFEPTVRHYVVYEKAPRSDPDFPRRGHPSGREVAPLEVFLPA